MNQLFFFQFPVLQPSRRKTGGLRLNQNIPLGGYVVHLDIGPMLVYKLSLFGGSATISPSCGLHGHYNNTSAFLQDGLPTDHFDALRLSNTFPEAGLIHQDESNMGRLS